MESKNKNMPSPMLKPMGIQRKTELDTDRIGLLLVKMALPAFAGMFVQSMNNVVNTIFVGQYVGTDAIGALGIVFPLQMFAMGIGMMVGIGGLSVISQSLGAGDNAKAERTLGNCFTAGLALSVLVMILLIPFGKFWLSLIGAEANVLSYAYTYLVIIISGTIFSTFSLVLLTLTRSEGNTRIGMVSMITGAILCIAFTAFFVATMKWGVAGSALATVLSQIVSMFILFSYYWRGKSYLKIYFRNFKPDFKILRSMLAIGISSFVQTVSSSISGMIMIHYIGFYGGSIALSAFTILQRIMMFMTIPAMVIGQGLQPILGFNYGARRFRLGLKGIYMAYISSTILSLIGFAVVFTFSEPLVRIFRDDPALVEMGAYLMKFMFLAMPLMGVVMVSQMIFQAIGKAGQSFAAAFSRPILFLIPLCLIFSHFWKLEGTILSFPAADILTFIFVSLLVVPVIIEFRKAVAKEDKENETATAPSPTLDDAE
jgi:putative MATE family efflux protein